MSDVEIPVGSRDVAVSASEHFLLLVAISIVMLLIPLIPFAILWDLDRLWDQTLWTLALVFVMVIVHELVHGISWTLAGNLNWSSDIRFGVQWKTLTPYCHARVAMTAQAYRIGVVAPGIVVGVIPMILAYITGHPVLAILGAVMISGAAGDAYVLWVIRSVAPSALVMDHPSKVGCVVLPETKD